MESSIFIIILVSMLVFLFCVINKNKETINFNPCLDFKKKDKCLDFHAGPQFTGGRCEWITNEISGEAQCMFMGARKHNPCIQHFSKKDCNGKWASSGAGKCLWVDKNSLGTRDGLLEFEHLDTCVVDPLSTF